MLIFHAPKLPQTCAEEPLVLNLANLSVFGVVFILQIAICVISLDVVARDVVRGLHLLVHPGNVVLGEMGGLEASENVDVPILQNAGCRVVSALVQLCPQLQPPITVNVVALDGPLGSLELIEFCKGLIASATNRVNVPIISLGICEISPARRHVLSLFQDIPSQNILVVLSRVGATDHEGAKPRIRDDCLISLGNHSR